MAHEDLIPASQTDSLSTHSDTFSAAATLVRNVAIYSVFSRPASGQTRAPHVILVHGLGLPQRYMMPLARELSCLSCLRP
jgi:hypothetical protein